MRATVRHALALVAAGSISGSAASADPSGTSAIVELDVAGQVVEVLPGDGVPMILTDTATHYFLRIAAGTIELEPAGIVVTVLGDLPANLLPHSVVASGDGVVEEAWLSGATANYRHGVLGDRLEAAGLSIRLKDGTVATLEAGNGAVFEDLEPRLSDLDGDGRDEIIVVRSYLDRGAALAVAGFDDGGNLAILAETPPIGRPNRWLNPIGAADFDGDGAVEIAYVETPHIGGTLMVWEWRDGGLTLDHAMAGFSNHAIGSTELGLAAIVDFDGDGLMDMAVPGRRRDRMRMISLAGGTVHELADVPLDGEVVTAIVPVGRHLVFGLRDGRLMALGFPD